MSNNQTQQLVNNLLTYLKGYSGVEGRTVTFKVSSESETLELDDNLDLDCEIFFAAILGDVIKRYETYIEVPGYPGYLFNYRDGIALEVMYSWD